MSKTVLHNAEIFTSNDDALHANALVIDGDKLTFVGDVLDIDESVASKTDDQWIDVSGRMIVPGFCDSHTHPGMVSQSTWHVELPWTYDVDEILAFVKDYAQKHPKEEAPFLYYEYYPTSLFGEEGPKKELLDTAVSDRPCMLQDFGEHIHWFNSKMLELMGVTKDTPDPVPGLEMFVRDENGEPTGYGKEFVWFHFQDTLYKNIGWEPPMKMTPKLMERFFQFQPEHGITAVGEGILEGEEQMSSMYELEKQGKLYCYYDGLVRFWSFKDLPEKIAFLREMQKKYTTKHIKVNTIKLFLDGTNESGSSALLTPHLNDPSGTNYGEIKMETDELADCFYLCNQEGLDLHIHMVGDRAFRVSCDAVEKAQRKALSDGIPWVCQPVFAHCELVDDSDYLRPSELGITINITPHWCGGYFGDDSIPYVGREKWETFYNFKPFIDSGALVCFSSDVTTFYELYRSNPFLGLQIGHTRVETDYPIDSNLYPGSIKTPLDARISREYMLMGYTIYSAKQMRRDDEIGSLEVGKQANLVVLSDNYFEVDADKIKDINFDAVIFDGELVHGEL